MIADDIITTLAKTSPTKAQELSKIFSACVFLKAQNVSDFIYKSGQLDWSWNRDFPKPLPPWTNCCVEWKNNSLGFSTVIHTEELLAGDLPEVPEIKYISTLHCFIANTAAFSNGVGPISTVWFMKADGSMRLVNNKELASSSLLQSLFEGIQFEDTSEEGLPCFLELGSDLTKEQRYIIRKDALQIVSWVPALAFSLAHCKNVQIKEEILSQELQRARKIKNKVPIWKTKELIIEPMQAAIRASQASGTGFKQSLHICRGHFKTFTPQHPLFGKHTGTYFWSQSVRGSAEQGVVHKDYNIKHA